jgi:hypothetical protein
MAAYRQFDGEIKVLEQINPWTFHVELWLLNGKVNRNGWRYERLREHLRSFLDTPILIAYPTRNQIGDGHNFRMTPDPKTGEMVPTFTDADAEHIVGRLSEKESDIRIEEREDTEWVVGTGIIWKWYARELVDKIAKDAEQGRAMSVSIETLVNESRMEGEVEVETSWEVLGTTILGDHVAPAVADARIKALRALREPFAELKIRAASWENKKTNDKPNHNDEKGVKNLAIKSMSKAQIKAAESKLPGYTVLSANELDNGTVKIVAAAKNGELFVCSAESVNDVTTEALTAHNMAVDVDGVEIDLGGALERMLSAVDVLTAQVEKLNADLADERKKNEDMANAEQKRRKNAAKTAAKNELAKINACRVDGEKINESCISEVLEAAENGEFSDCTDCNGEWCGEEKACAAVRDKAMQEQMKLDAARMNGKGKTVYAFEQGAKGGKAPASEIEQLYNEMTGNG